MHYVFMTYGIKDKVDNFVKWLETRHFPMKVVDKDGKETIVPVQGALRPVQLWEYVFPEESKDAVLTTLKADSPSYGKELSMRKAVLRKMLKCKPLPDFEKNQVFPMPEEIMRYVSMIPIGVRYDKELIEKDGRKHEGL